MLYLSGIIISFFLCLLLLSKKGKTVADKILSAWLFVIGVHLFFFYTSITKQLFDYPWLLGIHLPLPLLHGPFLFLYASALTGKFFRFSLRQFLHFLPALLSYLYLIHFFLLPAAEKIFVYQNKGAGYETFMVLNSAAITVSGILYVALTAVLHRRHSRKIRDEFSSIEKINLDWILFLLLGIALIWVFVIFNMDNFIFGTAVFFVVFIGYFGIRQVGIFTPGGTQNSIPPNENLTDDAAESSSQTVKEEISEMRVEEIYPEHSLIEAKFEISHTKKKYSKSGLSEEAADALHKKLNQLVQSEKVFTQGELTLNELAKALATHPNYLSQVINEKEGKNFYDYINTLRTEEFKKLIADPHNQKFTLLSLAFECGFNSKSSFNKYFKKVTGQAPSEYAQQLKSVEAA